MDIRAAFDGVAILPEVDRTHIDGQGICTSADDLVYTVAGTMSVQRTCPMVPEQTLAFAQID